MSLKATICALAATILLTGSLSLYATSSTDINPPQNLTPKKWTCTSTQTGSVTNSRGFQCVDLENAPTCPGGRVIVGIFSEYVAAGWRCYFRCAYPIPQCDWE